jgi:hypothetical protein
MHPFSSGAIILQVSEQFRRCHEAAYAGGAHDEALVGLGGITL